MVVAVVHDTSQGIRRAKSEASPLYPWWHVVTTAIRLILSQSFDSQGRNLRGTGSYFSAPDVSAGGEHCY
jgi:hypothetical protein